MGILNIEANINLKDCKSKEIFDLIKDGFYELLTRLNNENITDKKKNKIINFIMEEFKEEYKEYIDILLNTGFIDEDILNESLNIALDKGLITNEYYDKHCIKKYKYVKKINKLG